MTTETAVAGNTAEKRTITRVAGVVYLNSDNTQVLLFRHGPDSRLQEGVHGLPAGRLEEGESELVAAVREFWEETGLSAQGLIDYPDNSYDGSLTLKTGETEPSHCKIFIVLSAGGQLRKGNGEGEPVWVDIEKLGDPSLHLLLNTRDIVLTAQRFLNDKI